MSNPIASENQPTSDPSGKGAEPSAERFLQSFAKQWRTEHKRESGQPAVNRITHQFLVDAMEAFAVFHVAELESVDKRDCRSTLNGVPCGWKFTHDTPSTRHRAWTGTGWLLWDEEHSDQSKLTAHIASLRQQLSDQSNRIREQRGQIANLVALHISYARTIRALSLKTPELLKEAFKDSSVNEVVFMDALAKGESELSEAQGKVSQLEAELEFVFSSAKHSQQIEKCEVCAGIEESLVKDFPYWVAVKGRAGAAESQVSQLEAERELAIDVLKKACDRDWKDETLHQAAVIASNAIYWRESQVSVLTKEREEIANALMLFYHADMVEEDAAWELQMEPDSEYFATLPEACKAFYDLMDRECLKADKRLSAVSEVVPLATIQAKELHNARHGNIHSPDDFSFETCELCEPIRTALTNYEKAQQSIPE